MKTNAYPDYEAHRKIHADFVARIKAELTGLVSGDKQAGAEFSTVLGNWLLNHIAVTDHRWADYIKSQN